MTSEVSKKEFSNEEFVDRLVRYGFITPIPDDTFVYDPEVGGMVWSNDLNRKLWHGIPIRKLQGLNIVGLLAEVGYEPKKKETPKESISAEDAEKMMAEMRLRRLRELEDWE